jgi:hypothetical protein
MNGVRVGGARGLAGGRRGARLVGDPLPQGVEVALVPTMTNCVSASA